MRTNKVDFPFILEVGHIYKTDYTFALFKDDLLNKDAGNDLLEHQPSFLVVDRKSIADDDWETKENMPGWIKRSKNINVYKIMTPEYLCWIYLDNDDEKALSSDGSSIVELLEDC